MAGVMDDQVREATDKPENIRCVSIIGAHGHGKSELARNLSIHHRWDASEQAIAEFIDGGADAPPPGETTRTEVHVLMVNPRVSDGAAGAQSAYNPENLRVAIQKLDEVVEADDVVERLRASVLENSVISVTAIPVPDLPASSTSPRSAQRLSGGPSIFGGDSASASSTDVRKASREFSERGRSKELAAAEIAVTAPADHKHRGHHTHRHHHLHRKVKPHKELKRDSSEGHDRHHERQKRTHLLHLRKQKTTRTHTPLQVPHTLVYLLDTPGHADFAADTASSLRLSDGAIVVADIVEGCSAQLAQLLRQTLLERVQPMLFVSGLDRCIVDLRMSSLDIHARLRALVDHVNDSVTDSTDELLGETRLDPAKGDAVFGSTVQGWAVSIERFAKQYASKFGLDPEVLAKQFWECDPSELAADRTRSSAAERGSTATAADRRSTAGATDRRSMRSDAGRGGARRARHRKSDATEASSDSDSSRCSPVEEEVAWKPLPSAMLAVDLGARLEKTNKVQKSRETMLATFVLEPLAQLVRALVEGDWRRIDAMLFSLGMQLSPSERDLQGQALVKHVMHQWLNLSDVVMDVVKTRLPSPRQAQIYRVESLYGGPVDDVAAIAIRTCDPEGPLMAFVSRMLPDEEGRLYALGRVFSGTLDAGASAWLRDSIRRGGIYDSQTIRELEQPAVPTVPLVSCSSMPCGNICAIFGLEDYLLKAATVTDLEDASDLTAVHCSSVRPVVRVAVKPSDPADLPKLTQALRRLSKVDSLVEGVIEEWGEHVLRGSGQKHMNACLETLRQYFEPAELVVSVPGEDSQEGLPGSCGAYHVAYRETVSEASSTSFWSSSPDKSCEMETSAAPLCQNICAHIEGGLLGHTMDKDARSRALINYYDWSKFDASRIWCFSSPIAGANCVVDETPDGIGSSKLEQHLDVQAAVSSAYQWAAQEGALCEESMRGIRFNVKNMMLHSGNSMRGSGQTIGTARRGFLAAQLGAAPSLQEPIFHSEVLCPRRDLEDISALLSERRGVLLSESAVGCSELLRLMFEVPAVHVLDLDAALSDAGCSCPAQSSFSHWSSLPGDSQSPGRHRDLVLGLRRWRHLEVIVPTPEDVLGPGSRLTLADVFEDDLLDLVVHSS